MLHASSVQWARISSEVIVKTLRLKAYGGVSGNRDGFCKLSESRVAHLMLAVRQRICVVQLFVILVRPSMCFVRDVPHKKHC